MVVEKSVLMKVVFPRPDSPATCPVSGATVTRYRHLRTMMVKLAPRFATILCLLHVRLAGWGAELLRRTAGWATAMQVSKSCAELEDG